MSRSIGRSVERAPRTKKVHHESREWWIGELYTARRKGMGAVLGKSAVAQIVEILEAAGVKLEPLHSPTLFDRISNLD